MKGSAKAAFGIAFYFLLLLAPLIVLLVAPRPPGREFWRELSVALGFAGLSLMGLQFVPTARLPFLADVFPMDTLYAFHHRTSVLSLLLMLAHPLILFVNNPYTLRLLNVFTAPLRAQAAVLALLGAAALVVVSVWREGFELKYEPWRFSHGVLAVAAVVLAFVHIFGVGYHTAGLAQRVVWIALALVWAGLVLYVRVLKPLALLRRPYEVQEVRPERGQSWTLSLAPDGHPGLRFDPGQVAWLTVHTSPFNIRQHPFSFTSSAEKAGWVEFTIKELGDFTSTVKSIDPQACKPGTCVYIDGPYGTFSTDRLQAPGYVFYAGGIGSAPFMSILRTMADRGDRRPVLFLYGSKTWDGITFREELEALQGRMNLQVVHVLEEPPEGWTGERGFMNAEMLDRHLPPERNDRIHMVCGPLPMIDAVEQALRELHVPIGRVYAERYEMA